MENKQRHVVNSSLNVSIKFLQDFLTNLFHRQAKLVIFNITKIKFKLLAQKHANLHNTITKIMQYISYLMNII